jgi:N-acetylglucosaminyldiphosphoundecaprenol N-acetyl-beta-D-mannosaminyltransferase
MTSAIDVSAITPTGDVDILGVQVANVSMSQAIAIINDYVRQGRGGVINFLNAHCANVAMGDADYKSALDASDYVLQTAVG